jgi:DNA-binding response OmpR family regulator/anti-sigma regulatory factor (Ser/Thr protein kinase)
MFHLSGKNTNIIYELNTLKDHVFVQADREKLEIILFNLLSNAFKFTPDGGLINITVDAVSSELHIEISDTGSGIGPEIGEKIFQKFYTDNRKGIKQKPGFGIGMFLTKNFVEMHQGKISYTSEIKKGTTFSVILPIVLPRDLQQQQSMEETETELSPLVVPELLANDFENELVSQNQSLEAPKKGQKITQKPSLLIVDDDKQIREYLVQLFQIDYIVYDANSGEKAWELVQAVQPEIVISDVVMGDMNGLSFVQKSNPAPNLGIFKLFFSANSSSDSYKLEGIEEGADDYINKPFDSDLLKARVSTLIKNRKNLQEFFYNAITLQSNDLKISPKDKEFIENCIKVVEAHIKDENFNVKKMALEIGVSHSSLYKRVKAISGKSVNEFVRDIRLRKAAQIFIDTDATVNEAANMTGFYDVKYFRVQFSKLFGINPSEYIKKYRKAFQNEYRIKKDE